ncbi:hypothetical protein D7I44_17905 (plasmid) [Gryllotalpicola protaetiae]|uniref:Uncharacterized protein n=1 Tax=Gryllotalpicola protaetiae TaxID=2419771 RepID=A0A387BSI8_9MICO|nr:hypothetical protein D7I44_17905 [Gryllotalpicola protaetiae]
MTIGWSGNTGGSKLNVTISDGKGECASGSSTKSSYSWVCTGRPTGDFKLQIDSVGLTKSGVTYYVTR